MANYQSHYFTSQHSGVLQVYSVSIHVIPYNYFWNFQKTDQTGEESTTVTSILELSSDPLRPRTVNFYNKLSKAVYVKHLQSPLAAFESLQLCCYYIVSSETHG